MFRTMLGIISHDMAIDLGTATTRIAIAGRGVVCSEATTVAVFEEPGGSRRILAVGDEALKMAGRTPPEIQVIRPIIDGGVSDFPIAEALLRQLMIQVQGRLLWVGPRVVVCVPYGITDLEKRALRELAEASGAREVHLVEQPIAAALGAELPIEEACGHMVVDVGAGATEIAVMSLGGVVYSRTLKVGGDDMDRAIIHQIQHDHGLAVGSRTAEALKRALGAAMPSRSNPTALVKGRDLHTGLPAAREITAAELYEALQNPLRMIIDAVRSSLEHTPPELAADVAQTGIVMVGGAAQLRRLDRAMSTATGLPVVVPDMAGDAVVLGAGLSLSRQPRSGSPRSRQAAVG